jgi:ribosomal protein S27AE
MARDAKQKRRMMRISDDDAKLDRKNSCSRCGQWMTWAQARSSFDRMIRKGFTPEEAKQQSPICGKCIATIGKAHQDAGLEAVLHEAGFVRSRRGPGSGTQEPKAQTSRLSSLLYSSF